MKQIILLLLLSCFFSAGFAQDGQWTWMQGDDFVAQRPEYGTKGVAAPTNRPGVRNSSVSWTDTSGNLWLFGGYSSPANAVILNDLWKYDAATGWWTWMSGDHTILQRPVYGTKGIAAAANKPGPRVSAVSWTDASGNLWLFGGYDGYASYNGYWDLNDLWKYVPSTGLWTWVSGDSTSNHAGVYGTKGVAVSSNMPAGRSNAVGWTDASGNLWLFGGQLSGAIDTRFNDLWKYVPSTGLWTWVSGDSTSNHASVYGNKGTAAPANRPRARLSASSWTDASGNLWLFGGYSTVSNDTSYFGSAFYYLNDLWKYVPSTGQWTWMSGDSTGNQPGVYGTQGIAALANKPGARWSATSWSDTLGNLWLFGGRGYAVNGGYKMGDLDDIWKYVPSTGQWTWMGGDSLLDQKGVFGPKGAATSAAKPGGRYDVVSWNDASGNLWVLGGTGRIPGMPSTSDNNSRSLNDLWRYAPATGQWAWMSGDNAYALLGVYGTKGIAAPTNKPGQRESAVSWTDASGNLWMFGGTGYDMNDEGSLNDLWKYVPSTGLWTWVSGDSTRNHASVYGNKGTAAPDNRPGGRYGATGWTDASGNLWLFGGGSFNDLWKYTPLTGEWTWISGDQTGGVAGVYGTKGTAAPTNKPAGRYGAASWTDASGNLWLFGGYSTIFTPPRYTSSYFLNDLWKYTPSTGLWTWVSGDNIGNQPGIYGTKGIAAPANKPAARENAAGWIDASGNLWLFGGSNFYNDLWKYAPSTDQWTWVSGDSTFSQPGIYGIQGKAADANKPGARGGAVSWVDTAGNFWLFGGGSSVASVINKKSLNDLWKYVPSTGQWTWMKGDSTVNPRGIYGIQGKAAAANKPGGRRNAVGWADASSNLWLFGGNEYFDDFTGGNDNFNDYATGLNDLWKYSIPSLSLPVYFSSFTAYRQRQTVLLNWITAQEQNSRCFVVERSSAGALYDSIGVISASGTVSTATNYSFTDMAPLQGNNFYRLKQLDFDGKSMYSKIAKVHMDEDAAGFAVIQNPAQNILQLQVQLPAAGKLTLQIRDISGHLLVSEDRTGSKGSSVYSLLIGHLSKGTYLINVQTENMNITKRFLKQ